MQSDLCQQIDLRKAKERRVQTSLNVNPTTPHISLHNLIFFKTPPKNKHVPLFFLFDHDSWGREQNWFAKFKLDNNQTLSLGGWVLGGEANGGNELKQIIRINQNILRNNIILKMKIK